MPHAAEVDEEGLAATRSPQDRRREGAYYTPGPLVAHVLERVAACVPPGPLRVVDPACGAGAFLNAAAVRFPRAELVGLELSPEAAELARGRVPRARIVVANALRGGVERVLPDEPDKRFELWVGNPPYNGTSPLLRHADDYARARALLPEDADLPRGTSLRDDFAFFLLLARARLQRRPGALAFITPATLLDGFLYAPLRRALLEALSLIEVIELGSGAFQGTRVRACITVWSSRKRRSPAARGVRRERSGPFLPEQLGSPEPLLPAAPEWLLRPVPPAAAALDAAWRAEGEPLTELIPLSFSGLKTRFDELLVNDDPDRLFHRVKAFVESPASQVNAFARAHGIPSAHLAKLAALKSALPPGHAPERGRIRPFFRYAGARHRGRLPDSARAWCYLDRALIPRGDHRLRGDFDPHAEPTKLLFNVRELPLSAALLFEPGCVHDHRHARFAPLWIPERLWHEGLAAARPGAALGPPVLNLSLRGRAWAKRLGGPVALLARLVAFINSPEVQDTWAPAFGALRTLPVSEAVLARAPRWKTLLEGGVSRVASLR